MFGRETITRTSAKIPLASTNALSPYAPIFVETYKRSNSSLCIHSHTHILLYYCFVLLTRSHLKALFFQAFGLASLQKTLTIPATHRRSYTTRSVFLDAVNFRKYSHKIVSSGRSRQYQRERRESKQEWIQT